MLNTLLFRQRVAAHGASAVDEDDGWNEGVVKGFVEVFRSN